MPKPEEFKVHTMGGNISGNNNIPKTAKSALGSAQSSISQSKTMQSSQPSPLSKPGPLGGMNQNSPSKTFTGAPVSGGVGSNIGGGSSVQTMGGSIMEDSLSGTSSNKLLKIFIGVFVGIILVGGAVFGVFFLKNKDGITPGDSTEKIVEEDLGSTTEKPVAPVKTEPVVTKPAKTRYSDELLNYLLVDIASETVLSDIQKELDIIRTNLPSQNFSEPITFIVTNKQNKPISFSDFAVYADMGVPSDVLLALDDRFEIYAYNDFSSGVRFGFRVDVKNQTALTTALDANASAIPPVSLIFFKNFMISPDVDLKFNNGSYKSYVVKYLNLNQAETNSVDYIVDEDRWILGTSQKTLRAIVDKVDKKFASNEGSSSVENGNMSESFLESLSKCSPDKETYVNGFTGENATREIIGMENGKCVYIEEAPDSNSGIIVKTSCNYSDKSRLQLVEYYKKLNEGGKVEFSIETDSGGNTISKTIVGGEEIVGFSSSDILEEECTLEDNLDQAIQDLLMN